MKKIIALLLVLAMALGLVACGGSEAPAATEAPKADAPAAEAPAAEAEKITLNVVAAQYGGKTAEWWVGFETDFEAENTNVDLVVDVPSWNDIYTVVNTRIANGAAPDILNIDVFADYQADGLLLPAQDYISEETYAKFYPQFIEQSVVDDVVWAVPDLASARALYYNADILAEAGVEVPTTWTELKAACEAIKAKFPDVYPWGIDMTTDEGQAAFAYYAWGNGGGFVDEAGNWVLNSAENIEAVNYSTGLIAAGLTNTDPSTETRYMLQDMFATGQLAMMIGPNQISTYVASTENPINFGVANIPANDGKTAASVGVMDRFMVFDNGHSDEKMEVITKFFDFFYEDQRYSDWVIMEDFLPATTTGGDIMVAANPDAAAWLDVVGGAKFYPTAKAEWADVKQGVIDVQQQVLLGGNAEELLNDLQADIAG